MSTGRKVGIVAIAILIGGIVAYYALQDGTSSPQVSTAATSNGSGGAGDASENGNGRVAPGDPAITRDDSTPEDDERAADVRRMLDRTARPSATSTDSDTPGSSASPSAGGTGGGEAAAMGDNGGTGGAGAGAGSDASATAGTAADTGDAGDTTEPVEDYEAARTWAAAYEATAEDEGAGGARGVLAYTGDEAAGDEGEIDRDLFSMDDTPADTPTPGGATAGGAATDDPQTSDGSAAGGSTTDRSAGETDGGDDGSTGPLVIVQRTGRTDERSTPRGGGPDGTAGTADGAGTGETDADGRQIYTVQSGDSLWIIASKTLGSGVKWRQIADANADVDKDTVLQPGMKLIIPKPVEGSAGRVPQPRRVAEPTAEDPLGLGLNRDVREVTVGENESLWKIAQREYNDGTKWRVIYLANRDRMDDPQDLHPGDKLRVPPLPEE